jgi:hypothetical protein
LSLGRFAATTQRSCIPNVSSLSKPLECGLSLSLALAPGADAGPTLKRVAAGYDLDWGTLGIGEPLVRALGKKVPGLTTFPAMSAPGAGCPRPSRRCG